jgi:hypothetical protein
LALFRADGGSGLNADRQIVSKRLDRPYVSGPTRDWIKVKCAAWKEENRWRAEVFEKTR